MDGESYGYGGRYYFSNSSTYETYIVDINGHYTKLSTTTYTSVCHTTTDGYVAFNADSTAYLYDVTDTTVHTLGSLGGSQHGFKLFDFDDKLYWAVPTQTRNGSSYTYGMRLYLYNKSTKTVSTTSYSGQDISFNGGKPYVAYKTSFIQDGILFDYADGNYVRLTTTSPQAGKLTLYTNSSKQYTLGRCEGDTVYVYPTGVIVPINKSKISGTVSFTDVQLSSGKYAIINCTLTPIEVALDKQDTSAIVIDRYKVSISEYENVRYAFTSMKNQEGSVRYPDYWHTTNTYESNGYGQCCRFRWYHFKESDNPEYTLIITGFAENSDIKPSTALLTEVGTDTLEISDDFVIGLVNNMKFRSSTNGKYMTECIDFTKLNCNIKFKELQFDNFILEDTTPYLEISQQGIRWSYFPMNEIDTDFRFVSAKLVKCELNGSVQYYYVMICEIPDNKTIGDELNGTGNDTDCLQLILENTNETENIDKAYSFGLLDWGTYRQSIYNSSKIFTYNGKRYELLLMDTYFGGYNDIAHLMEGISNCVNINFGIAFSEAEEPEPEPEPEEPMEE